MSDSSMTLQALIDREQITELIYRYCRSVDRLDVALGQSIWHPDSFADYGPEVYQGHGPGVIEQICSQHRHALRHSHQVTNLLITLDGDRAGSEAYVIAALRVRRAEKLQQITVWSRYVDRWSRRDGRWGLDHRIAIRDFDEVREVHSMSDDARSARDTTDPSYAALSLKPLPA